MFNSKRTVFVVKAYEDIRELAADLYSQTFTLCSAFEYRGLLLLNDSFTEEGAQEYAIVRKSDMRQLDSLTVGWSTPEKTAGTIEEMRRNMSDDSYWHVKDVYLTEVTLVDAATDSQKESYQRHRCNLCR